MEIVIENAVPRFPEFRFVSPVNWRMRHGENWVVIGPNGAGKTLFANLLQGKVALREGSVKCLDEEGRERFGVVKFKAFRDIHSLTDSRNMYYQQRWNSSDAEESPFASTLLEGFSEEKIEEYSTLLGVKGLLSQRIISLSSGELRKFLIMRLLMTEPEVLILDNPFIGLDAASREAINTTLRSLYERCGLQSILILSHPKDIPSWVSHILPVKGMRVFQPITVSPCGAEDRAVASAGAVGAGSAVAVAGREGTASCSVDAGSAVASAGAGDLPSGRDELWRFLFETPQRSSELLLPERPQERLPYDKVVEMHRVSVKYAGVTILKDIDWTIKKGEKWALLGPNGSGKSMLLSLVCGDNPQAYANDITLFGRRRGTGESIWEIKRRIGYLSPDMHTYYMEDIPCLKVVASGFFDSIGLFRKCTDEQLAIAMAWMRCFSADYLAERSFVKISYGEQRLVLLVRAFVKSPELLILDEPLHGLDMGKKELAKAIIEQYCASPERTLIYVSHYPEEIPSCVTLQKRLG